MTGYGRAEHVINGRTITVELKSVNNRYLDCFVRMPRLYLFAEEKIKALVQGSITRGKVDVFVTLDNSAQERVRVCVNHPAAESYFHALTELAQTYHLPSEISVSLLSRFPEVLLAEKAQEDVEKVAGDICAVLSQALEEFDQMRTREGARLGADMLEHAGHIEEMLSQIEARTPDTVSDYRSRLEARMREVLENTQLDPARIMAEAAIYADKVAVDEETVRLRSHLSQLREMLADGGVIGRKLDFLIQEFNREANTIGSKCNDITMTRLVVEIKSEIEKIREQIQNIE